MNSILIGLYTLLPNIITFSHAEEWDPFDGCDLSTTEGLKACKIADPPFSLDIGTAFSNMLAKWSASFSLMMLNLGTVDVFGKTNGSWNFPGVGAFIDFFNHFAWLMFGIGVVLAVAEAGIAYMNGQGNMGATTINICKALMFATIFSTLATQAFSEVIIISNSLAAAIAGAGNSATNVNINAVQILFEVGTSAGQTLLIIKVICVIIYLVLYFFFMLGLGKRYVNFLLLLGEGSLLSMSIARGYAGQLQSFVQKMLLFFVGIIANVTFFNIGAQIIGSVGAGTAYSESLGTLIIGFAFMTGANKVFNQLGTVGSGGDIGMAMHAGEHAVRIARTVGSAIVTGGTSVAAEGAASAASVASSAIS